MQFLQVKGMASFLEQPFTEQILTKAFLETVFSGSLQLVDMCIFILTLGSSSLPTGTGLLQIGQTGTVTLPIPAQSFNAV